MLYKNTSYLRGFPTTWVVSKETIFFVANVFAGVWSLQNFATSLLNRSTKLSELVVELETAADAAGKGPETNEGKRVKKPNS